MAKSNFFISYTKKDKLWAEWIEYRLEQEGYTIKTQSWDYCAGNYATKIDNALINSERYIMVLTQDYFATEWCTAEWAAALAKDPENKYGTLIPVRVEECIPKGLLAPIVYIDLVGLDEEKSGERLLNGVNPPGKPEVRPVFTSRKTASKGGSAFPQSFPKNNIPLRNLEYTGRKDTIDALSKTFDGGTYGAPIQVITGPSGAGKSMTALEYSYRHAGRYDVIRWINAESFETLLAGYIEFAHDMGLAEKGEIDRNVIQNIVKSWMENNGRWLFIFDNAKTHGDIREFLPGMNGGNILITSDCDTWGTLYKVPLAVFRPDEAVEYLIKCSKAEDREDAAKLSDELGFLPIALEQAASYIDNTRMGYSEYIELFKKVRSKIFEGEICRSKDYEKTIAAVTDMSMGRIRIEGAKQLIYICSFFSGGEINSNCIRECAEYLPEPLSKDARNEFEYSGIINELSRYRLIKNTLSGFTIHETLRRALMASADKKRWLKVCLDMVCKKLRTGDYCRDEWNEFSAFISHAFSIAGHAEEEGFEQALEVYKQAFEVYERVTGEEYSDALDVYYRVADSYDGQGKYDEAIGWYCKALKITNKVLGADHINTAKAYSSLASVYYKKGNHSKALELLIKSLVVYVKKQMTGYPDAKKALSELYTVYVNSGGRKEDFQMWLAQKLKEA